MNISNIIKKIDYDILNQILGYNITFFNVDINQVIEITNKNLLDCLTLLANNNFFLIRLFEESDSHQTTKYHKENLITHLYCVGIYCYLLSDKFNLDKNFAFKLGFFHDIGKLYAKKTIISKKKIINNYNGHSQIGEYINNFLNLEKEIIWCTSNHMCSCSHHRNLNKHFDLSSSYQLLSFDSSQNINILNYINSLGCLMMADDLGRLGNTQSDFNKLLTHTNEWINLINEKINSLNHIKKSVEIICKLHPDNSIIINMFGHSGFGKSTCTGILCNELAKLGITCEYAERDNCYYKVYSEKNSIPMEQLGPDQYSQIYNYITDNELKNLVQNEWVSSLNNILDSDSKVKIIDSVQLMYPNAWESTLNLLSPDAKSTYYSSFKLGFYGFPQYILEREYIPKTGNYEILPREPNDSYTYPNLNSELNDEENFSSSSVDIAYGTISPIINTINNYIKHSKIIVPEVQPHILTLINNSGIDFESPNQIIDYINGLFPPGIIQASIELNNFENCIVRFSYIDGRQIFHGPSRDYRGEMLLFNRKNKKISIARTSLPVFVDYSDMRKDPLADELIHKSTQFHVIPKYDGSLFVLTWLKKSNIEYDNFLNLVSVAPEGSIIINDKGIWCLGSKGCMFAKNQLGDSGVQKRIHNSIKSSYNSIENFINIVHSEIIEQGLDQYENLSICFEAIDIVPTDELTVDYGKAFCPMLCWIIWDGLEKRILLPENIQHINPVSPIYTFETWSQVIQFKDQAHLRLLDGSESDEPEGYVVWLGNSNIGIKLKHPEYYVAHKPYSEKNIQKAKQIEFDPMYSKLKARLIKFKPKPPIEELIKDNINNLITELVKKNNLLGNRKEWAIYWKNHYQKLDEILEILEGNLTVYYPIYKNQLKNKGFNIAIKYFENVENFYSEYLKFIKSYRN